MNTRCKPLPRTALEPVREAIRLGRLLLELLPEPEVTGLLALMLLQEDEIIYADCAESKIWTDSLKN